jgi:glycogen debranching enzyme
MRAERDPDRSPDAPPSPVPPPDGAAAGETAPVVVTDLPSKVLATKEGETFVYSDTHGNLHDRHGLGLGFYHRDTRFLSHLHMRVSGREPVLLSSSAERAYLSHVDLTNPDLFDGDGVAVPQQTLNIRRIRAVGGCLYERVRIKNYNPHPVDLEVSLTMGADFADVFEVRGLLRERSGHHEPPLLLDRVVEFAHLGLDGQRRRTRVVFDEDPVGLELRGDLAEVAFRVEVPANQTRLLSFRVEPMIGSRHLPRRDLETTVHELRRSYEDWERGAVRIRTDNALFDQLLQRGIRDLRALYTRTGEGGIVAAGIPWYVAPFGRDSLIAAHQMLMLTPEPARETLELLAARQGTRVDDWRDEEPGKILHEIRSGELAGSGEIPHSPYYGSVDSTPWFLILLAQYVRWTGDLAFARAMLPSAEAALRWIDEYGDLDGDGFVEYRARAPSGMRNQGWKDSWDAIVHEDGSLADPPIALIEVQAYVYLAKLRMAELFAALGDRARAARLTDEASTLRRRFHETFWMEDEEYFAAALDGQKRPVRTVMSNPGHALYCDVVDPGQADLLVRRLFQPDMFSGWGIRTMSKTAAAYNPMSYHNGSVWPHDNALIAAGMKRYGHAEGTNRVATALFDAAVSMDYLRLPELFCGFVRRSAARPVQYPVACSPQAWAAGAPFLLLQAMLGLSARAAENLLTVHQPSLPPWLGEVELRGLRVGDSRLHLVFRREGETTGFTLVAKEGDVRVVMEE